MTEQQNNEPEVSSSPTSAGAILSSAREAQGIALADLAEQIKVPVSVLEAIEKDRIPKNLPETFIRGYIRSYAKKVGVEESQVLSAIKTTAAFSVPQETAHEMQSFSKRTKKQAFERRLKMVSYIILSILIFALVLWWYQDSTNTDIAPLAGGEEGTSPVLNLAEGTAQKVDLTPQTAGEELAADPNTLSDDLNGEDGEDENTSAVQNENVAAVAQPEQDAITQDEAATVADESLDNNNESSAPIELTESQMALLADVGEADQEGFMKVEMLFEQECWVEVYDVNEERIAVGNKPAGYTMTLNAQGPFNVLLGNPVGVTIWVDGQKFDTDGFPRNRVARFELEPAGTATN